MIMLTVTDEAVVGFFSDWMGFKWSFLFNEDVYPVRRSCRAYK